MCHNVEGHYVLIVQLIKNVLMIAPLICIRKGFTLIFYFLDGTSSRETRGSTVKTRNLENIYLHCIIGLLRAKSFTVNSPPQRVSHFER